MLSDHSAIPYTHFPEYLLLHPMLSKHSALVNVKSLTFNKDRERRSQEFYIFYIVTHLILQRGRKHTQSRLSWKSHIWPSHPPKPSSDLQPESLPTLTVIFDISLQCKTGGTPESYLWFRWVAWCASQLLCLLSYILLSIGWKNTYYKMSFYSSISWEAFLLIKKENF